MNWILNFHYRSSSDYDQTWLKFGFQSQHTRICGPTPLAAGGVGCPISDELNYIEIQIFHKSNMICGILYRQHNSPLRFKEYFDETLEKFINSHETVYVMGDFNINLLQAETSSYAHVFVLSIQSFPFVPSIGKPTRLHNSSATLIGNILTKKFDAIIASGMIIIKISVFLWHPFRKKPKFIPPKCRDFAGLSKLENDSNSELCGAFLNLAVSAALA